MENFDGEDLDGLEEVDEKYTRTKTRISQCLAAAALAWANTARETSQAKEWWHESRDPPEPRRWQDKKWLKKPTESHQGWQARIAQRRRRAARSGKEGWSPGRARQ